MRAIRTSGVYIITNLVTNKVYIGSSKEVEDRLCRHKVALLKGTHHSIKLQRSYNKHGLNNFTFNLLLVCSLHDLLLYEQLCLDAYDAVDGGYNVCKVAGSPLGTKHTEKAIANMRAAQLGRKHTEETRRKISQSNMGKKMPPCTDELRKLRSLNRTGIKLPEETKRRMSIAKKRVDAIRKIRKSLEEQYAGLSFEGFVP